MVERGDVPLRGVGERERLTHFRERLREGIGRLGPPLRRRPQRRSHLSQPLLLQRARRDPCSEREAQLTGRSAGSALQGLEGRDGARVLLVAGQGQQRAQPVLRVRPHRRSEPCTGKGDRVRQV